MYNNIHVNTNNTYSQTQNSYSTINNFTNSASTAKKVDKDVSNSNMNTPSYKDSVSNTIDTIIDKSNQNQTPKAINISDFTTTKVDDVRGSFVCPSRKNEDTDSLRMSVIEKTNTNSLITKKDPSKPSYNPIVVLKSHFDSVRGLYVTPDSKYIVSAGEDLVTNVWDFKKSIHQNKEHFETYLTFRGHKKPIFSIAGQLNRLSNGGFSFYTGSSDGVIHHRKIIEGVNDKYDCSHEFLQKNSFSLSWSAHQDCIWNLSHHPSENLLLSISSDTTAKLWKGFSEEFYDCEKYIYDSQFKNLLRSFTFRNINYNFLETPTSSAWSLINTNIIYVSYVSPYIKSYDIESGKSIHEFSYYVDKNCSYESCQTNKVIVNENLKLIICGNEDKQIRFFDKNQGKMVKNMVAHTEGLSCLSIGNEEYQLFSSSQDGAFRCWDLRKYKLLYDVPAHTRRKNDEGCCFLIPNSTYQVILTCGGDGLTKIFKSS